MAEQQAAQSMSYFVAFQPQGQAPAEPQPEAPTGMPVAGPQAWVLGPPPAPEVPSEDERAPLTSRHASLAESEQVPLSMRLMSLTDSDRVPLSRREMSLTETEVIGHALADGQMLEHLRLSSGPSSAGQQNRQVSTMSVIYRSMH